MMVFALHIFGKYIRQSASSGVDYRIREAKEKWDGNREEKKSEFAEGKFISDRSAGVLSEPNPLKAVRRVLRDKEREGVAKGRESATELLVPLIFCMRPCENRRFAGKARPFGTRMYLNEAATHPLCQAAAVTFFNSS